MIQSHPNQDPCIAVKVTDGVDLRVAGDIVRRITNRDVFERSPHGPWNLCCDQLKGLFEKCEVCGRDEA